MIILYNNELFVYTAIICKQFACNNIEANNYYYRDRSLITLHVSSMICEQFNNNHIYALYELGRFQILNPLSAAVVV